MEFIKKSSKTDKQYTLKAQETENIIFLLHLWTSCLGTGKTTISLINANFYSMPRILVLKRKQSTVTKVIKWKRLCPQTDNHNDDYRSIQFWQLYKMFVNLEVYHLFHHFWNKVIHLCKNFVSSLFLFCTLGIVLNIVADKVSFGSAGDMLKFIKDDMFQKSNIEGMCNLFSTIHHNHQA
jgi:hypothetical protein